MSDTIETCEVDGCDNDADTIAETYDENDELIGEKLFCRKHIDALIFGETQE